MTRNPDNQYPISNDEEIKELEGELKSRERIIESLNEKLNNNKDMLQDIIAEKNELLKQIREYNLKMADDKINQCQKLLEEHQKTVHRLQVTKEILDKTNAENRQMQTVIEDLKKRGFLDYIIGRYPQTYLKYKEK